MELNDVDDYWPCADGLTAVNVIGTQVARSDKLETDPMAYGGKNKWTSPRKSGEIPRLSTRFSAYNCVPIAFTVESPPAQGQ